jgi:exosome complex RNA-binding protein Rrp4
MSLKNFVHIKENGVKRLQNGSVLHVQSRSVPTHILKTTESIREIFGKKEKGKGKTRRNRRTRRH